jgi:plastocyanin
MKRRAAFHCSLVVCAVMRIAPAQAIEVQVIDFSGKPLADAVVFVSAPADGAGTGEKLAVIDQVDKRFEPVVSVMQTGTAVKFPNKDNIRHHVYSFSPAKIFELKLYSGVPTEPVVFDQAGLITMGCNIHDGMVAYVYVVDTPTFALTDNNGRAELPPLESDAVVKAWHYQMISTTNAPSKPAINSDSTLTLSIDLDANAPVPPSLNE